MIGDYAPYNRASGSVNLNDESNKCQTIQEKRVSGFQHGKEDPSVPWVERNLNDCPFLVKGLFD